MANVRSVKAGIRQFGSLGLSVEKRFSRPDNDIDEDEFTMEMIDAGAEEVELKIIFMKLSVLGIWCNQEKLQGSTTPDEAILANSLNTRCRRKQESSWIN